MRADTSSGTKEGLTFLSSSPEVDATKRPQLVAGVTDGASPPIAFVKGDACPDETHMTCTSKEVEASVGFDGYSERRCGNIENEDKTMVGMTISRATNKLESCEKPKIYKKRTKQFIFSRPFSFLQSIEKYLTLL